MTGIIQNMKKLKGFWTDPAIRFVTIFGVIFLLTFTFLFVLGLVPSELRDSTSALDNLELRTLESVSGAGETITSAKSSENKFVGEEPRRVSIPGIDVDIKVENPTTKDNTVLDEYLTKGAVRYPDSPLLGLGNTLIFGHSSNWAVVHNKAYKALNGIENLKKGDMIFVDSDTMRYVYRVTTVSTVEADKQYVDFSKTTPMLTLSTCDLFGDSKQLRFVVTATLDEKIALP